MKALVLALLCAASLAHADVCKDDRACLDACFAGNPVSCVLAFRYDHPPKSTLDGKDRAGACTLDSHKEPKSPDLCGAYAWADGDKAKATKTWESGCLDDLGDGSCEALAVVHPVERWVGLLAVRCSASHKELPCRLGSLSTKHVEGEIDGVKYGIDLPGTSFGEYGPKRPGEHFFVWGMDKPAVKVRAANGKLTCEHVEGKTKGLDHADHYAWLPAGWGDKACASLKTR